MPEPLDVIAALEKARQVINSMNTPNSLQHYEISLAGQILVAQEIRRLTDIIKNETISVHKASFLGGGPG